MRGDMVMIPSMRKCTELFHSIYNACKSTKSSYFVSFLSKKSQILFCSLHEWSYGLYTAVSLQTKDTQCMLATLSSPIATYHQGVHI